MSVDIAPLPERGILGLAGPDRSTFLQTLVSNDVLSAGPGRAIFATLLTPQGKFLHELLIAATGDRLLVDTEMSRLPDLQRRLTLYRLRAKVDLADLSADWAVFAAFGQGAAAAFGLEPAAGAARVLGQGSLFVDPRLDRLGVRIIAPRAEAEAAIAAAGLAVTADFEAWDRWRLALGVPDGSRDIQPDKSFLLESNIDELNGISFTKGCYVGQELTARTKHRGTVRKRLFTVRYDGPAVDPGTPVMAGDREVGTMRSGRAGIGLASMRLDELDQARAAGLPLLAGGREVHAEQPDWVRL